MDFYSWLYNINGGWRSGDTAVLDEDSANKEWKETDHPRASKGTEGAGQFKVSGKTVEKQDLIDKDYEPSDGKTKPTGKEAKELPPPTYDDLKKVYEEKGVCDELVDLCERLLNGIVDGEVSPKRMPREAFSTEAVKGLPPWLIYGYLVGSNYWEEEPCQKALIDFAKAADRFSETPNKELKEKYGESIGGGVEANVYKKDDQTVAKVSTLGIAGGPMERVERLMLSNHYFPDTAYSVDKLGQIPNGEVLFMLEQPWIDFADEKLSDEEIGEWLKNNGRGWHLADSFVFAYASEGKDLACLDMHGENVVKTKTGKIVCVDPCVVPNYYDLMIGGHYNAYEPPERFE